MNTFEFVIPYAIYGRVAQKIVFAINSWNVQTYILCNDRTINAGSLIGLLSLGLVAGDKIMVYINCDNTADEQKYFEKFKKLFEA